MSFDTKQHLKLLGFLSYNLSVVLFVIGKYAYILWVGGKDEFSTGQIFRREGSFQGVNFSGEILGEFATIPRHISLYVLLSFNRSNFTRGGVKGNFPR